MDSKNNANPAASDDKQNTPPQTDAQQDAMPSLGDETVQGTDVGNGSPAPDTTPEGAAVEDVNVSSASASAAPVTTPDDTSSKPPEVESGADASPSIASEAPAATPADAMPPAAPDEAPESTAGAASDMNTPTQTMPSDQQAPSGPVPPVAPVPTPGSDKKTILILGIVAAVLLVSIAALYFVV